jgi:YegS/Rv2252/BmrU family lipid kinase
MIGIFVHPAAGKGRALKVTAVIEKILTDQRILFVTYKDNWPAAVGLNKEAWIVGGDGTLNYFINKYRQINIPLVIFKGGTGNDFAWQLYGEMDTQHQVNHVLNANAQPVDAAVCNDHLFVNSVGIGFDGEVLRSMGAIRRMGGHIGYLWVVIKKIFRFKEFDFTIHTGDTKIGGKFLLVNIANAARTGGGFLISPQAKINDAVLNLVLCKPLPLLQRLRILPVVEKGKHLHLPVITHRLVTAIHISTAAPAFAQLDGELIQDEKFDIQILPAFFLFKY